MSKVETRFDTKIALSVANAIYRKKGYVKTTEADYGDRKSNKSLVLEELAKENPKYTGTLVKGIATMHKSNAVPVINQKEAEDIAKMRRG